MTRKSFQNAVAKMAGAEFEWHSIEVVVEKVTIIGEKELTSDFAIVAAHHNGKDFRTMFYHYPSMKQVKVDYAGRYEDINEAYEELGKRAAA